MDNGTIRIWGDGRRHIKINGKWVFYATYVAKQNQKICGEWFEGCETHHIDFDKTNDVPENLVFLSKEEHRNIHKNIKPSAKRVIVFNNGVFVKEFDSMANASKYCGIPLCYIRQIIKGHTPSGKYDKLNYTFRIIENKS